jgi:hypothetical protein
MPRFTLVVAAFALIAAQTPAGAQTRFSVEVGPEFAFATEKLGGETLNMGGGFEVLAGYQLLPRLVAYAGWDWHRFTLDETLGNQNVDIEDTGYAFGLRVERPLFAKSSAWLRAGGTANHIELESDNGSPIFDSGHGLGWEVGAGLIVPVAPRLQLTPGVRYRALSRDIEIDGVTTPADLNYVTVGMGLAYRF